MADMYSDEEKAKVAKYEMHTYSIFCELFDKYRPRFLNLGVDLIASMAWQDFKTFKGFAERPDFFDGYTCHVVVEVMKDGEVVNCELDGENVGLIGNWCIGSRLSKVPFIKALYRRSKKYVPYHFCSTHDLADIQHDVIDELDSFLNALKQDDTVDDSLC